MAQHSGDRKNRRRSAPDKTDSDPVLPSTTSDERNVGWGEDARDERDEEWYRRERPPHHE